MKSVQTRVYPVVPGRGEPDSKSLSPRERDLGCCFSFPQGGQIWLDSQLIEDN
jgi:hypothetical protein